MTSRAEKYRQPANGVASFDLIRNHCANDSVFLYAFDLRQGARVVLKSWTGVIGPKPPTA